jgi:hypothetical protein
MHSAGVVAEVLRGNVIVYADATAECRAVCAAASLQERISGPLSVLAATWNVGNALPPSVEQLREQWLRGAAE